jgi:elongation factor P--beta-lysine ligase
MYKGEEKIKKKQRSKHDRKVERRKERKHDPNRTNILTAVGILPYCSGAGMLRLLPTVNTMLSLPDCIFL